MFTSGAEAVEKGIGADVCVIGAGAVGITLALELGAAGLDVVLVDQGRIDPAENDPGVYTVRPGTTVDLGTDADRPLFLGGNTNHWFGNCRPLDPFDFEQRDGVPYSGWPLDADELRPFYERAQRAAGLGSYRWYDVEEAAAQVDHGPLALDRELLQTRIVQCCPILGFADLYASELRASTNLRVIPGVRAMRLSTSSAADRVSAVETVDGSGRVGRLEADVFVLAGGGVENARLLLVSNEVDPAGLGNAHDLVGRFFMEHWFFELELDHQLHADLRLYEAPVSREDGYREAQAAGDAHIWGQLVLSEALMRERRSPGLGLWLQRGPREPSSVTASRRFVKSVLRGKRPDQPRSDVATALSDPVSVARHVTRRLRGEGGLMGEGYSLRVELEQVPDPENRITLSSAADAAGQPRPELRLALAGGELERALISLETVLPELDLDGAAAAAQLKGLHDAGRFGFFFHHMGTTRMSDDPADGVVGRDCRVHGLSNLYVAGSSVFPTGGTAAPTLTAIALGLRLADHLSARSPAPEPAVEP
jgi:choline dehydrogenase-like flavoprotein